MMMGFYMYMPVRNQHLGNINYENKICIIVIYGNTPKN